MSQTPHGITYPSTSEAPDGPAAFRALADSIEARCFPYTVTLRQGAPYGFPTGSSYSDVTGLNQVTTNDDDSDVFSLAVASKISVVEAGVYDADAAMGFALNGTGNRALSITVNGTSVVSEIAPGFGGNSWVRSTSKAGLLLPAGAVVALQAWQTSDGAGDLNTVPGPTFLSLTRRWSQ